MDKLERRQMERFFLELPAFFTVKNTAGEKQLCEFRTRNICAGGAYFDTEKSLSIGTEATLDIKLPVKSRQVSTNRQTHIIIEGKVVRSEQKGMAIRFNEDYQILPLPTDQTF